MTITLEEAIAEVKRVTPGADPWTGADMNGFYDPTPVDFALAVIVNAALSGDLIPRTDHELAVALAYQRAGDSLLECGVWCDSQDRTDDGWRNGVTDARKHHMAHILALAPADALAEAQALKAELNTAQTALALADFVYGRRAEAAEAKLAEVETPRLIHPASLDAPYWKARAEAAVADVARLQKIAHWNVNEEGDLVRLCRGEHPKGEPCEEHEEVFIPSERAARICEILHRKGVSPEKWPDYFRSRKAGSQLLSVAEQERGAKP